jgi:hypothetical protein
MLDKQNQAASDGSTAIQAGGNVTVINQGTPASEVREIAREVCKSVLGEYTGLAIETARKRGEEITERLIEKLLLENPTAINQAQTPEFQDSLLTIQREHAKVGDEELAGLLVDLLVDQTKEASRSLLRNVLNEALRTAPRLSPNQIAALSALFILFNVTYEGANSLEELGKFLDQHLKPFASQLLRVSEASLSHLEFAGCGIIQPLTSNTVEAAFGKIYSGLFQKGISQDEVEKMSLSPIAQTLIIPCLNDSQKLQVGTLSDRILERRVKEQKISDEEAKKLLTLLQQGLMTPEQIQKKLLQIAVYLQPVFEKWEKMALKSFSLTVVGRAIAHANIKRTIEGPFAPLAVWVAELDSD